MLTNNLTENFLIGLGGRPVTLELRQGLDLYKAAVGNIGQWTKV